MFTKGLSCFLELRPVRAFNTTHHFKFTFCLWLMLYSSLPVNHVSTVRVMYLLFVKNAS